MYCDYCKRDIHDLAWAAHTVNCPRYNWYCEKCSQVFSKLEKEDHNKIHQLIECKCGEKVERREIDAHRLICKTKCPYCELQYPNSMFLEHKQSCGSRTEPCESCGVRVQIRDIDQHQCQSGEGSLCPFCMVSVENIEELQTHILIEHDD